MEPYFPKDQHCANCDTLLQGPVCHQCSQKYHDGRWTTKVLFAQFVQQLTNIERGFLYTAHAMLVEPAKLIRGYWERKTVLTYNPFRYVLILVAINILINFWLGIDDLLEASLTPDFVEEDFGEATVRAADEKLDAWFNALILLLIPFFALVTYGLFARHNNNYAEHLILNSFIMGEQSLITGFTHFIFYFFPSLFVIYLPFNFLIGLGYNTYVFRRLYHEGWWVTLGKAFLLGIAGLIVFFGIIAGASVVALGLSG